MKFATNPVLHITHLTLGMLLHYLGKLKSQFFLDIQQIMEKIYIFSVSIAFARGCTACCNSDAAGEI